MELLDADEQAKRRERQRVYDATSRQKKRQALLAEAAVHAGDAPAYTHTKTGKARNINRGFGVAGAYQHAAIACHQRENMAGRNNVLHGFGRVDGNRHGLRAVMR